MIKLLIPIIVEGDLQEKQRKYDFPCCPIYSLNFEVVIKVEFNQEELGLKNGVEVASCSSKLVWAFI